VDFSQLFADPFTLVIIAVIAVLVFFMFRNGRKRQAQMRELQAQVVPGAEVITQAGIIGTIVSMDEEANQVQLETFPGSFVTVHRQTVTTVLKPALSNAPEEESDGPAPDADKPSDAPEK